MLGGKTCAVIRAVLEPLGLPAADQPSILWLTAEDVCPQLGCYGDACAVTPNLDRFATQAVHYTQTFGIAGVSAPRQSGPIAGELPA